MKKLLTILGSAGLVATTGATVVACGNKNESDEKITDLTILRDAINGKEDIKDTVDKNWNYSSFFNINGEKDADKELRILDIFYQDVKELAKEKGYDEEKLTELHETIFNWSQKAIHLVYIDVDSKGNQYVASTITQKAAGNMNLEEMFLDQVQAHYADEDVKNPEFWTSHPKLSLGISFDKNVKISEELGNLLSETKDFWTFTFKTA